MAKSKNVGSLNSGISPIAVAVAVALGAAQAARAQVETSALQGHVDGVAAGTQVVAVDKNTGQRVIGAVDASGDYVIFGLRPSTYTVTVPGRDAQTTTVLVGQTAVVDFAQGPAIETVTVSATRRTREVRTQTVATNITPEQIENLPQNKRNFLSFAALAPGVQVSPGENAQVQAGAIASQFVNEAFAKRAGLVEEQLGLGHAYEINPRIEDSFLLEIAQAQLIRQIFDKHPIKWMPPTKHHASASHSAESRRRPPF